MAKAEPDLDHADSVGHRGGGVVKVKRSFAGPRAPIQINEPIAPKRRRLDPEEDAGTSPHGTSRNLKQESPGGAPKEDSEEPEELDIMASASGEDDPPPPKADDDE